MAVIGIWSRIQLLIPKTAQANAPSRQSYCITGRITSNQKHRQEHHIIQDNYLSSWIFRLL